MKSWLHEEGWMMGSESPREERWALRTADSSTTLSVVLSRNSEFWASVFLNELGVLCVGHFHPWDQFTKSATRQHGPELHLGHEKKHRIVVKISQTDMGSNSSSTTWSSCFYFLSHLHHLQMWNNSPNFILVTFEWDHVNSMQCLMPCKLSVNAVIIGFCSIMHIMSIYVYSWERCLLHIAILSSFVSSNPNLRGSLFWMDYLETSPLGHQPVAAMNQMSTYSPIRETKSSLQRCPWIKTVGMTSRVEETLDWYDLSSSSAKLTTCIYKILRNSSHTWTLYTLWEPISNVKSKVK